MKFLLLPALWAACSYGMYRYLKKSGKSSTTLMLGGGFLGAILIAGLISFIGASMSSLVAPDSTVNHAKNNSLKLEPGINEYLVQKLGQDKYESCCRLESVLGKGQERGVYEPEYESCLEKMQTHYETVYKEYCAGKVAEALTEWAHSIDDVERVLGTKFIMPEEAKQYRRERGLPVD